MHLDSGAESIIFRDREKLSPRYLPSALPHREEQIEQLYRSFRSVLDSPSEALLKTVQIIGPAGSGKTSCALKFGRRLEEEAGRRKINVKHLYVNLKLQGGSRVVLYRYLLESAAREAYSSGLSAEETLRVLLRELRRANRYLVVTLDEIDYFLKSTKETGVVYDLTRLNEIEPGEHCNVVGVIFTARSGEFHEKLDPAELSTLGRIPIEFSPYRSPEILDIVSDRAKEAFRPGAVSDEALEYISDVTGRAPVNGDVRYALDLLLYSGNLAENSGAERVIPDHVRLVHGETHPSITQEDILNLPKREQLIALLSVVRSLKKGRKAYARVSDIIENCSIVSEERRIKPIQNLDEYLQDLADRGMIEVKSLTEIGIGGVPAENLEPLLDSLLNRVESGLH